MSPHTKPTQSSQILSHLMVHGSITPREAIEFFQCYRLAARVHELRQRGHVIDCDLTGGFARYSLTQPVQLALSI
jgi:hypothetical protein